MLSQIWRSLSGRLLMLTVIFVMVAEILIFVPSVSRFRQDFLVERLEKGRIAALAATEARDGMPSMDLQKDVLDSAGLYAVLMSRDGRRQPMLMAPKIGTVAATFDLRDAGPLELLGDALAVAFRSEARMIRVIGALDESAHDVVEVVMDEGDLRAELLDYAVRIFWLSLLISAITACLVFVSVNAFVLRPIKRVTNGIMRFREDPEDPGRVLRPSGARDEIGDAERELAHTQQEVLSALKQKSRLAALGEAVAKINHDLRNILASSQLLADRLERSQDPTVMKVGPKLIASLDRAIRLCQQTLTFGKAEEAPPDPRPVVLSALVEDVRAALGVEEAAAAAAAAGPEGGPMLAFENRAPADLVLEIDPDQMFRALHNLCRNALQALEGGGGGCVTVEASADAAGARIDVIDDGPGLPEKARENLFKAFKGSARRGGSGLGLAIAAELVRGHRGALTLEETGSGGTRFRISLPADCLSYKEPGDAAAAALSSEGAA